MAQKKKILVIAPHADDETLGMGGAIARYCSEGHDVHVAIMTGHGGGSNPVGGPELWETVRAEARNAVLHLGDPDLSFFDLPAVTLVDQPLHITNKLIADVINKFGPDELYIPFLHDLHKDHQAISYACLVAARGYLSTGKAISLIAMYEVPTETHLLHGSIAHQFLPTLYVCIDGFLDAKLQAWSEYKSQHQQANTPRSPLALESLARLRGSDIGTVSAEAFMVIRQRR